MKTSRSRAMRELKSAIAEEAKRLASEILQDDFDRMVKRAKRQVVAFRALAKKKGWHLTEDIEIEMEKFGRRMPPDGHLYTTKQTVGYLTKLYKAVSEKRRV